MREASIDKRFFSYSGDTGTERRSASTAISCKKVLLRRGPAQSVYVAVADEVSILQDTMNTTST
jgi:hypothetical protein